MKNLLKNITVLSLFLNCIIYGQNNSLEIVKSVVDRIIEDTQFEIEAIKQEPVLGVHVLDFQREFGNGKNGSAFLLSFVNSEHDTTAELGISASDDISIWLNDRPINFAASDSPAIKEIAYGMVNLFDTVSIKINKGENKLLIKSAPNRSKIFLKQITDDPEEKGWLKFSTSPLLNDAENAGWLIAGPFEENAEDTPESEIKNYYKNNGIFISWRIPDQNVLMQLKIKADNIFKKDSYADWNYANGETILSILNLAEFSGEDKYRNFVKNWCDYIIQNIPYFRYQYDSLHALRGSFHRIFRMSMLDDAGAPVLPFAQLFLEKNNKDYNQILFEMVDYVYSQQVRLTDGTFCRPEPVEMTVWADDLFMSVPLLLRIGKITNEKKYFDDAVKQIKNFTELLYNRDKKLFKHGWFSQTNETSVAFWGRANGWVMWALSETLIYLPDSHEGYSEVLSIYKNHIDGIIAHQGNSGMWHQVLDHVESYEESSCTAMFILGIARGVNNGWLDESYSSAALKGWNALATKINNGIVQGICRGTGIGSNLEFYFNRPTFENDPRGLGAVITAGIEISKMETK